VGEEGFGGLDVLQPSCGFGVGGVRHEEDNGDKTGLEEEVTIACQFAWIGGSGQKVCGLQHVPCANPGADEIGHIL
jgi:hypothetical protein